PASGSAPRPLRARPVPRPGSATPSLIRLLSGPVTIPACVTGLPKKSLPRLRSNMGQLGNEGEAIHTNEADRGPLRAFSRAEKIQCAVGVYIRAQFAADHGQHAAVGVDDEGMPLHRHELAQQPAFDPVPR